MSDLEKAIQYLKEYNQIKKDIKHNDFQTFRSLMNITMPFDLSHTYYELQDRILQDELHKKQITDVKQLNPMIDNICLFKGDITTIQTDAIVNACNSHLLGCFTPLHSCIDNAIHSFAGLQVRRDLIEIMSKQGIQEPNGMAKITKGYNLPCQYILHTVGPIVKKVVTKQNELDLANCYLSCLKLAEEYKLKNITFCSIATGLYGYPIQDASVIALTTIRKYFREHSNSGIQKVIINVFTEGDLNVYKRTIATMAK